MSEDDDRARFTFGMGRRTYLEEVRYLNEQIPKMEQQLAEARRWCADVSTANDTLESVIRSQATMIAELQLANEELWALIEPWMLDS